MRRKKFGSFVLVLTLLLFGCGNTDVIPDDSMFELYVTTPKTINANQTVDILVDIKNNSNYNWTGIHGVDLFKYIVRDSKGKEVSTFEGMRSIDDFGVRLNIENNGIYSFYKSDRYQRDLNQLTIKNPGIYTLEVKSNFTIEQKDKTSTIDIKSEQIEFVIK